MRYAHSRPVRPRKLQHRPRYTSAWQTWRIRTYQTASQTRDWDELYRPCPSRKECPTWTHSYIPNYIAPLLNYLMWSWKWDAPRRNARKSDISKETDIENSLEMRGFASSPANPRGPRRLRNFANRIPPSSPRAVGKYIVASDSLNSMSSIGKWQKR